MQEFVQSLRRAGIGPIAQVSALVVTLVIFADIDILLFKILVAIRPLATDFSCFWTGARVALHAPSRLYDFAFVTRQQAWLVTGQGPRPFIYPPSALILFVPFALLPFWQAYAAWVLSTGALFMFAAMRAGARWWLAVFPPLALVVICGQVTFLIGALVVGGITSRSAIRAGLLFGLAACVKPQCLVLLPIALIAARNVRTLVWTVATGGLLVGVSLAIWGAGPWMHWARALPAFQQLIDTYPGLTDWTMSPRAALIRHGAPASLALGLAPFAAGAVWLCFRTSAPLAERLLAFFGATLVVTPYAMNYEMALLAVPAAIFLTRRSDNRWAAYLAGALAMGFWFLAWFPALVVVLAILGAAAVAPVVARRVRAARIVPVSADV